MTEQQAQQAAQAAQAVNAQSAEKNKAIKGAIDAMEQQAYAKVQSLASGKNVEQLRLMALVLDDMHQVYEPIRDAILDEKARITGWAQCADQFVKIIADRAASYKHQAVVLAKQQAELAEQQRAEKASGSNGTRKKRASRKKEVKTSGDNISADRRELD